jgi:protein-disulfide isomerase
MPDFQLNVNRTRPGTRIHRTRIHRGLILALPLLLTLVWAGDARARAIRWGRVINANPSSLSAKDKRRAARLMNQITVYYGCSDTVANCLVSDPQCQTARRIAGIIVRMVKKGRTDARIKKQVKLRGVSAHPFKKYRFNLKKRPRLGAKNAKVTLVEFGEFQCPFCKVLAPILKRLVSKLASRGVVLVFKHYTVSSHSHSIPSSRAAYAAHKQGKFWQLYSLLFKKAPRLSVSQVEGYARSIGLDLAKFRAVRDSRRSRLVVAADKKAGLRAGVKGTPTFFINGKPYKARKDYMELLDRLEEELNLVKGGR